MPTPVGWPCLNRDGTLRLRYTPIAPHAKQFAFLAWTGRELLAGGSAGPGKSTGLLMAALQFADVPGYNALIFRRTLADLKLQDGMIDVAHDWLDGKAHWNGADNRWTFRSGATLQFGYMGNARGHYRYKSSQLHFIGFDELTEMPWEEQYTYMFSRLRHGIKDRDEAIRLHGQSDDGLCLVDIPLRMRSATNPGGPGNSWVYRRFLDPTNDNRKPFIPSTFLDNPGIDAAEYTAALAELPEVERRRLQDGDWSAIEIPGALWRFEDITYTPEGAEWTPDVRVVSVDPSVSAETKNNDECGIVVGSIRDGVVTVETDLSDRMHPDDWARLVVTTYHAQSCDRVVCEDNQGGALVFSAIANAADSLGMERPHVVRVKAKESKEARAIPVVAAYRDGKVRHDPVLQGKRLETQMCSWVPGVGASPDRVDAVVWLVRNLLYREGDAVVYHTPGVRSSLSRRMPTEPAVRRNASALRQGMVTRR